MPNMPALIHDCKAERAGQTGEEKCLQLSYNCCEQCRNCFGQGYIRELCVACPG